MQKEATQCWEETITIPTYGIGEADKSPHFLEKRVYQGSSGKVYPHHVIDKIKDEKKDVSYKAVFLENQYIKVMVLPELGGRIQMAFDKTANRHFVYYNHVIKPALVGLAGPWISGGIEFNWPQHHRPSTFDPIDFNIESHKDGSQTLWVGETEKMFRTRGLAGFRVYPNKAYIEITGKVYNGTSLPQTFLWWANPAIKASGGHQSIFPPDVNAVFDHGKRAVSRFPIATGTYYKADYSAGVDISKYNNIPVPTSYMAYKSNYDFVGAYNHDEKGGLLHVASHHVSPGKKQWTWGNGNFGKVWDENLTDADGPYIELMTGVFTDNQPDFAWLEPYEEKIFTQYFMPYRDLGVIKNANQQCAVKCDIQDNRLYMGVYATEIIKNWKISIFLENQEIFHETLEASPDKTWLKDIPLQNTSINNESAVEDKKIAFYLYNDKGELALSWQQDEKQEFSIPEAAIAPKEPKQVQHIDELLFIGQHIEQYRHATVSPDEYYLEALNRDAEDSRANTALARLCFRRGDFLSALTYANKAIKRIYKYNTSPFDMEIIFQKALILEHLGKKEEAYNYYYKSTWCGSCVAKGFFALARISFAKANYQESLSFILSSLQHNGINHKAKHLHICLYRKLNKLEEGKELIKKYQKEDALELALYFELYLYTKDNRDYQTFLKISRKSELTLLEIANDYIAMENYEDALTVLKISDNPQDPVIYFYLAYLMHKIGNQKEAMYFLKQAENLPDAPIFANKIEDIHPLEFAVNEGTSAKAAYLLGNLFYDKCLYDKALALWEKSAILNPKFATIHRNLGIAYFNKKQAPKKALEAMKKALQYNPSNGRFLFELNDLYLKLDTLPTIRKDLFESHIDLIATRDDLLIEWIRILNLQQDYNKALNLITSHKFHPWEGGEGKITSQYVISLLALGIIAYEKKEYQKSCSLLETALHYPSNLGEGKLETTTDNDVHYWLALAYKALENKEKEQEHLQKATLALGEVTGVTYYNDQPADYIFYQGLAYYLYSQDMKKARTCFYKLIDYGESHMNKKIKIDFFAVSLPDFVVFDSDLDKKNQAHCYFVLALGYWGLGKQKYKEYIEKVLQIDPNHDKALLFKNKVLPCLQSALSCC